MKTTVVNRQRKHRPDISTVRLLLPWLMERVQRLTRGGPWNEVSLVLTDNAGIARINGHYLAPRPEVTDVISFRYASIPGESGLCGDVFVNVDIAAKIGPAHGGSGRELALYIAHGCDHLGGAGDQTRAGFVRMRRRELRWLMEARKAGLVPGDFT